jgi:regulator of protease activity HflC (stomatin/prohibitin superfamily)
MTIKEFLMSTFFKQAESKLGVGIMISVAILFFLFKSVVIVNSGYVGVVKRLGAVQPISLHEGFHFIRPFIDTVEQMDIRLSKGTTQSTSASKDLQTVKAQVTIQYSLSGALAPRVYQRIGTREMLASTVVAPAIQESVKAVTAKYTAEELVTRRSEVKIKIQEAIELFIDVTLTEKDLRNCITISNVAITDFDFSDEFNRAIELKVKAEQEALQAKNEKTRRVTQAEAGAEERKLAADAEAYQIARASEARAAAIQREAKALKNNPELIQLRFAEKWDGRLPTLTGGAVPFLNMDGLLNKK